MRDEPLASSFAKIAAIGTENVVAMETPHVTTVIRPQIVARPIAKAFAAPSP